MKEVNTIINWRSNWRRNNIMESSQSFIIICLLLMLLGFSIDHSYADIEHNVSVVHEDKNGGKSTFINIGLIVDMESFDGKVVHRSIMMALSDFYKLNRDYRTRISIHVRDSRSDSLHCIAAVVDLLENVEVHAIIIPKISNEELFLARLCDKAQVPLLSFSPVSSSNEHPYFIQVSEDENNQFHAIASFLEAFKWRSFVCLYEDTTEGRQAQTHIHDIIQENHLDISYQNGISPHTTDDQIVSELRKLLKMKASIILLHLPPALASQVFLNAKKLGMMSKGFVWILTTKTMNFLESLDSSVYDLMQGVVGFKSYVSASGKIQSLTLRWRREFEMKELNVFGVWAYDAAWVLAEAIERTRSNSGLAILSKIKSSKYTKLVGKLHDQLQDIYEIMNVIGKGGRRVGFWTSENGLTEEINPAIISSTSNNLETIIWPGFSSTAPKRRLVQMSGKSFRIGIPAKGITFPVFVDVSHDQQRNLTLVSGLCADVFRSALERLPYTISYEFIPYNGTYADLVNEVYLQTFDGVVGDITILANRSKYVDFTVPYTEMGVGVLVKLDEKDIWFFLKPLSMDLWITSVCFFLLVGFIIWLVEHPVNQEFQGPPAQQIGTALWFAASTLVYAHRERLQSNVSRFVVSVWLFVVLILTSSYTAKLSSLLTVEQIKLTKNDYLGYYMPYGNARPFVNNLNFNDNRLKPLKQSREAFLEAFRKGSKRGGIDAVVEELPYLRFFVANHPNEYAIVDSMMTTGGFGFPFQKGSQLGHDISIAIAELREEGKLEQMKEQWFSISQSSLLSGVNQEDDMPNHALTGKDFFGLFLLSGITKSIALLIFLIFFLLREKLSKCYYIFTALASGKLTLILRYFYPEKVSIHDGIGFRM